MKTAIYFLDASSVPEEEALLRAAGELSRSRQEKAAKLRFPEDRILSLGAGLLLDANIHFGDPQGFLCLRVLLPVLAMGLCLLRAIKENKRDGDK